MRETKGKQRSIGGHWTLSRERNGIEDREGNTSPLCKEINKSSSLHKARFLDSIKHNQVFADGSRIWNIIFERTRVLGTKISELRSSLFSLNVEKIHHGLTDTKTYEGEYYPIGYAQYQLAFVAVPQIVLHALQ
eukprot:Gb_06823 [translate_table: standard]